MPPRRCRGCYQNVELHAGCSVARTVVGGKTVERVRWQSVAGRRCPECRTIANGYHHHGCPGEECPVCGRRVSACRCARPDTVPTAALAEEPYEAEFGAVEKV